MNTFIGPSVSPIGINEGTEGVLCDNFGGEHVPNRKRAKAELLLCWKKGSMMKGSGLDEVDCSALTDVVASDDVRLVGSCGVAPPGGVVFSNGNIVGWSFKYGSTRLNRELSSVSGTVSWVCSVTEAT